MKAENRFKFMMNDNFYVHNQSINTIGRGKLIINHNTHATHRLKLNRNAMNNFEWFVLQKKILPVFLFLLNYFRMKENVAHWRLHILFNTSMFFLANFVSDHRLEEAVKAAEHLSGDGSDDIWYWINLPRPVPVQRKHS